MKNLLLALLTLILSANAWADDEFPLEITCEVGANIIYLHFDEDEDKSWWKNHFNNSGETGQNYYNKKDKQKFNSIDNLDNLEIKFWVGSYMGGSMWFRLNRINGKIFSLAGDGQCYKGFKEYEKQI